MTDNEIIKALECCINSKFGCDEKCLFFDKDYGLAGCLQKFLDLINRQKAENERLKAEIRNTDNILNSLDRPLVEVKSEAIKEFAERLKELGTKVEGRKGFEGVFVMANNLQIDNLVKEMVGDTE